MADQDTRAVIERLDGALAASGLSLRRFARAMGTSPSRFVAYRCGRTAPAATFLLRAERIALAFARARVERVPSSIDAVEAVRAAANKGDGDWTYALVLEVRDRLHSILRTHPHLAAAWEAQPPPLADRWQALIAAFVAHEFDQAGMAPPRWTTTPLLDSAWVLDTPRLSDAQITEETPSWLAERNIFIAEKDLATA